MTVSSKSSIFSPLRALICSIKRKLMNAEICRNVLPHSLQFDYLNHWNITAPIFRHQTNGGKFLHDSIRICSIFINLKSEGGKESIDKILHLSKRKERLSIYVNETLFIAITIGTPAALACAMASFVWGRIPSSAATTMIAMSVTLAPRALIAPKAWGRS